MGGYAYSIALANKPKEATVVAAGRDVWDWFFMETRGRRSSPIGERVHDYVAMYMPSASADGPRIRFHEGEMMIGIGDAGGTGYHTMLATMHTLALLLDEVPDLLLWPLERFGLVLAKKQPRDEYIREQRFLFFDEAVAQIFEGSVSRDSNGEDDGAEVPIDSLPAAQKKRVQAFIASDACECPICATKAKTAANAATSKAKTATSKAKATKTKPANAVKAAKTAPSKAKAATAKAARAKAKATKPKPATVTAKKTSKARR
jgi:hypothetical protein